MKIYVIGASKPGKDGRGLPDRVEGRGPGVESCMSQLSKNKQVVRENDVKEVAMHKLYRTLKATESSLDFISKAMRSYWKFLSKGEK